MDDDGDDAPYALLTPAVRRRDTITRQLQREILGEMGQGEDDEPSDAAHTTPEGSSETKGAAPSAQNRPEQEHKTEEDEPPSSERRRRTLSPSKAALLQDADAAVSRRDTVSPEALKAVLKAAGQEESSPVKSRGSFEASEKLQGSPARKALDKQLRNSPDRPTTPSASKRPRSASKQTTEVDEHRRSVTMASSSDSFTDSMFAPNLLEQDSVRRTTLDPTEAASVVAALEREVSSLNSSAFEMDDETESDGDNQVPAQEKESKGKKLPSPAKESKRRKSPTPAKKLSSRGSPSPPKEARPRKSPSSAKGVRSRKSPSPTKEVQTKTSPTLTKSNSTRRTTVDPGDVLFMHEDSLQQQEDGRRQTIDDNGLLELTSALESPSTGKSSALKRREEASRKRANDSYVRDGSPEKRARSEAGNNIDETMECMKIDSPVHADAKASSPLPKSQQKARNSNQRSPDKLPPSRIPKPSLLSPPPGGTRIRTPLKGILSARKGRREVEGAMQTTPNKSVNFGPSQGAEFNHGSPSTSMTPMLAKVASRLFPSEPPASSGEEPDDAETSLNSSILDEADSLDEEEPRKASPRTVTQHKKSGFDLLQSRRSSLLVPKSTDKSRRRHSLRGYSPLDAQTEARRRRRQTISVTRQNSSKAPAASSAAAEKQTASSQSPSPTRNNSFLRATDVLETSRMPYADSSASSDAGEDMEITGDYSFVLGVEVQVSGKPSIAFADLPRDEDTAEFSLGHLLAESSVYELTKSAPEPDLHDLPGSLGDLANEVADIPSNHGSQTADASLRLNDQDTTLDPIEEIDETLTSSRGQSMMSLDSGDDSDPEYSARRESLKVNLKSKFDRVSTGDEPSQSSKPTPMPEVISVQLITMEKLISSVTLSESSAMVETDEDFFGKEPEPPADETSKDVKLACAYDTCSEVVDRHAQDISSWSTGLTEELSSLLNLKAPALFSPENLDDAGREAIQELYATEAMVARSGWCQLQTHIEKELTSSLSLGANALGNDVKTLKTSVSTDAMKRQNELAAIREMIDREEQMGLLLDAIEEQQGAHDEYVTSVKDLEKECSSLSLEESVLQSRLKVLEGRAAELEPVTSVAATLFEQEVLATEEMLAIQESMSVWKIREATASLIRLSARLEDVLFDVEICVDVHLGSSLTSGASTSIKTNESLKRRQRNTYLPYEGDAVLVLQRLLLDPHYISRVADESEQGDGNDGRVCSKLQVLEHFITRSFRLLKELRELSTRFAMRFDEGDSTLWVDFLKFPSTASQINVEGAQFSVGFSLLPVFPYTDYQTDVQVPRGQISTDDVTKEIELVPRQEPKYFTRVCRRLHESFVR